MLLLLPLAAMPLTDEVTWTASDVAFAAVLLFAPLGVYELAARTGRSAAYRAGVAVALVGAIVVVWGSGAVGITDSRADALYGLALAVGLVGAAVARFRPRGTARAMAATALGLVLAGVAALATGTATAPALEVIVLTGLFATLFGGSAGLFGHAAREARTDSAR